MNRFLKPSKSDDDSVTSSLEHKGMMLWVFLVGVAFLCCMIALLCCMFREERRLEGEEDEENQQAGPIGFHRKDFFLLFESSGVQRVSVLTILKQIRLAQSSRLT
jgi:hypothetical protein